MMQWLLIELGGSSVQTSQRDSSGRFWFTPNIVREPGRRIALACPGLIRDRHVLYATNLGWPEIADPAHELGVAEVPIVVNDAAAAGLGEAVLRADALALRDLIYISLGTGVGSVRIVEGDAVEFNLGHLIVGGDAYCEGCRAVGCLNAILCARSLPKLLAWDDQQFVARTLADGLAQIGTDADTLIVLGGGIARRYPEIVQMLDVAMTNLVERTMAPSEAKSAAYAGLDYLAHRISGS